MSPGEGQLHSGGGQRRISQRAQAGRGRPWEGRNAGHEPQLHPPPGRCGADQATEMRSRSGLSMLLEVQRGCEWLGEGSLSTVPVTVASTWSPHSQSPKLKEEVKVVTEPSPEYHKGLPPGRGTAARASPASGGRTLFLAPCWAATWLCPDSPGEQRRRSKTSQIQILK